MYVTEHKEDLRELSSLADEGKELAYDSDAEHPPLDEAVCYDTRECGEQPATEVRQRGQEAVLGKETQTDFFRCLFCPGKVYSTQDLMNKGCMLSLFSFKILHDMIYSSSVTQHL